jgi:hypothetical protein
VAAGDGATIRVVLGDGGSLSQRSVHPVSLVQKRRHDIIKLFMGPSGLGRWRRSVAMAVRWGLGFWPIQAKSSHGDSPIYRGNHS